MISRALFLVSTVVLLVVAGGYPAAAESGDSEWVARWSNGFKVESADGQFKLKFGGRIQADFTFSQADAEIEARFGENAVQDGFEIRRARLFFEGLIYERVKFKAQYDFAGGDADFKDVYIGLVNEWGDLTFGHQYEPFSLEASTSSKYIPFVARATPVLVFAAGRNSGVSASGSLGDRANWGIGAFYDADDFGESFAEGRYNLTGRLGFRPIYEERGKRLLHVGLGVTNREVEDGGTLRFRGRTGAHFGPRAIDTQGIVAESAFLYALEFAGVFNRAWLQAEYLAADVDSASLGDPSFDGFYVQTGFFLTGDFRRFTTSRGAFDRQWPGRNFGKEGGKGAWEIAARYSSTDLEDAAVAGGELDGLTLGINWYLNPATRLMVDLEEATLKDVGDVTLVLVRWQVDF
jgi:phosphate-selective porin OprO/OprP